MNTLFEAPWLADLTTELPPNVRLQRLMGGLRAHFCCGAVALLRLEEEHLRPVVVDGLVSESLGRRFAVHQHPRLVVGELAAAQAVPERPPHQAGEVGKCEAEAGCAHRALSPI